MLGRPTHASVLAAAAIFLATPCSAQTVDELAKARLARAEALLSAGDHSAAEPQLREIAETAPTSEWTHWARFRLSECLYHQGRFDESISEARKVANLFPSQSPRLAAAWSQFSVGLGYKGKGMLDVEIAELEKVESILGDDPDRGPLIKAKYEMALAHHNRNNRPTSMRLCREILADPGATDADRAWARVVLGSTLIDAWKTAEGIAELENVRNQFPGLQDVLLAAERKLFEARYLGRHDHDGAIREGWVIANSSTASEARARQARYYIAISHLRKGDNAAAIAEARALLERYPAFGEDHLRCRVVMAQAYAATGNHDEAAAALEAVLAMGLADTEFLATVEWDLATCYRQLGDAARAREHYQRVFDLYPASHLALRAARELAAN